MEDYTPAFLIAKELSANVGHDVMGYLRPASQFNKGKKSEFEERKPYEEREMLNE